MSSRGENYNFLSEIAPVCVCTNDSQIERFVNKIGRTYNAYHNILSQLNVDCGNDIATGIHNPSYEWRSANLTDEFNKDCLEFSQDVRQLIGEHPETQSITDLVRSGQLEDVQVKLMEIESTLVRVSPTTQIPSRRHRAQPIMVGNYDNILSLLFEANAGTANTDAMLDELVRLPECSTRNYVTVCVTNGWYGDAIQAIVGGGVPDVPDQSCDCPECGLDAVGICAPNCHVFTHLVFQPSVGMIVACPPHTRANQIDAWKLDVLTKYGAGVFIGCGLQLKLQFLQDGDEDGHWVLVETDGQQ